MSKKVQSLISAGIDIGTSTTKIIISRLTIQNTAGQAHVPRFEIVDKEVLYQSPIFRTPLLDDVTIDVKKIEEIVFQQYKQAQIEPQQIQTGVVLITGETATKKNARELIHFISDAAGEFLVATAGPDLESILAAKGSGAVAHSKKTSKVVANIDIGGGTTNIAVLKHGEVIGTVTLHLGGRLIEYVHNQVISMAPSIQRLLQQASIDYKIGDSREVRTEQFIIQQMITSLNYVLCAEQRAEKIPLLLGHVPNWQEPVQVISFSGGVAHCMYPRSDANCDTGRFDDLGKKIAEALMADETLAKFEWIEPVETVRATVTGAGSQSTDVSGATIEVDASVLPIKNVPVLTVDFNKQSNQIMQAIEASMIQAVQLFDTENSGEPFALYLNNLPYMNFADIDQLAESIATSWPTKNGIILLILEADYAKVLGQSLLLRKEGRQIVCIDQIFVRTGDYIDIGNPLQAGVVPVVVKTLAFHKA
ncbi:ethanolamine utilization protein [Lysinibacillus sp. 2017]|uniref:ethanolamine ammonia-lyase reactivating factor EutA n=1 Tax=unclassified Lysinibacillus TaxID=2636778 RepID=UPI000D52A63E|nr:MULTISPECIES: ethanolamine ammonia-lyase reactivating factor EutA [unclassified Lysinibacillus]AWE07230.1 ethanolamine utilization protein [Lysinibacillus sp. 2017]TGN34688.1 ethanolamine utilization protein [Lysinibacillus sp. S2017]